MLETTFHRLLSAVEQLAPDSSGALTVGLDGACVGTVFVERSQVCWAAYAGLRRRLRDLLREHLARALDDAELDRTYEECIAQGKRFGEELVSRQYVRANAMRSALKQHTIESLLALPQDQGENIDWIPHRAQGYQPRFTFAPAELLVAANAILYESEAAGSELALSIVELEARGATYVPDDDGDLIPVRLAGLVSTIAELDDLGSWAAAAFGVTRGFSPEVARRAIEAARGEVWIGWQTSRLHTHAVALERGQALERLVSHIEANKFPIVVSRRAAGSPVAVRDVLGAVDSNP